MHFGNKTNIEIAALIASGQVSYNDEVFSTDWSETLRYDGVVFKSICSCQYIGHYPPCSGATNGNPDPNQCLPVTEAYASFDEDFEPPGI